MSPACLVRNAFRPEFRSEGSAIEPFLFIKITDVLYVSTYIDIKLY